MKKIIVVVAIWTSGFVFQTAAAQVNTSINVNVEAQPVWGPVGYDYVEYYYLPDIDAFYSVPKHQYIYMERGRWLFRTYLPYQYSNYDIYTGYKVVVNEPTPYRNAEAYRSKYSGYKGRHDQEIIRDSKDEKYFENKKHPKHRQWRQKNRRYKNGRDK